MLSDPANDTGVLSLGLYPSDSESTPILNVDDEEVDEGNVINI